MSHVFRQKSQALQQTGTSIGHDHTPGAAATVAILSIVIESTTARTGGAPTIDGVTATQIGTSQLSAECRYESWYVCKAFSGALFSTTTPNDGALVCNVSVITADAGTGFASAFHAFDEDQGALGTEDSVVLTAAPSAVGDFLYSRIGSDENAPASVTGAAGTNWDGGLVQLYSDDIGNQSSQSYYSIADSTAGASTLTYSFSNAGYAAAAVVFKSVAAPVDKSLADSGSGADAQAIQATPSLADSGSGVDAQTIAASLTPLKATPKTDNFNRANGQLGSNWELFHYESPNYLVISSNEITGNVASVYCAGKYIGAPLSGDHYSQVEYRSGADDFYLFVRGIPGDPAASFIWDDFDRADANPIGGNWVTGPGLNDLKIVSYQVYASVGFAGAYYNQSFDPDQFSLGKIVAAGGWVRVLVRSSYSERRWYDLTVDCTSFGSGRTIQINRANPSAQDTLASSTYDIAANDVLSVQVSGTGSTVTIKAYVNGHEVLSCEDSSAERLLSGYPGLFIDDTSSSFDIWYGGDTAALVKFYHLMRSGGDLLLRRTHEANETLWSSAVSLVAGDKIRLDAIGNSLKVYKNTTLLTTVQNDWLLSGGAPGVGIWGNVVKLDNWEGGPLGTTEVGLGIDTLTVLEIIAKTITESGTGSDAIASIAAGLSVSDSGSGSDLIAALSAALSVADSGSGVDVVSALQVSLSLAESGIGLDELSVAGEELVQKTLEESGSGSDIFSAISVASALADSGAGSDVIAALTSALSIAEGGSGSDAVALLQAALAILETGAGADALELAITVFKTLEESGSGVDVISALQVALSLSESGSGADGVSDLQAALTLLESGVGIDEMQALITVFKSLADSGSGADAIALLQAALSIVDSGAGSDVISIIDAVLAIQDSGAGSDTVALIAQLILTELGSGADAMSVQEFLDIIYKTLEDGGTGADVLAAIQAALSVQDSGAGIDLMALAASIPIGESGVGVDAISLVVSLGLGDAGAGSDGVLLYAPLGIVDLGAGQDLLALLNQIALADEASGVDTMVRVIEGPVSQIELLDSGTGVDALSVEAHVALSELGAAIDGMLLAGEVVIVDAGGGLDRMAVPRLASARNTYDALARQREYDATTRKREYDATPRQREHDDQ